MDDAELHDGDAVAHGHGFHLVVRHVDHRGAELHVQLLDLGAHLHAELGVEVRERLVEEEHVGLAHDGAAEGDALPLSAGEGLGLAVEQVGDFEELRGVVHAADDFLLGELAQLEAKGQVLAHRHVRVQRVVLEYHRDVAVLRRDVVHAALADEDVAPRRVLEARHHAQRGGFAAARWTDEHHELAVEDLEVQVVDGRCLVVLVRLRDVFQSDGCHGISGLLW